MSDPKAVGMLLSDWEQHKKKQSNERLDLVAQCHAWLVQHAVVREDGDLLVPTTQRVARFMAEEWAPRAESLPGATNTAWPTRDVVQRLADFADYQLRERGYDGHGWEELQRCRDTALAWLALPHREVVETPLDEASIEACARVVEGMCWPETELDAGRELLNSGFKTAAQALRFLYGESEETRTRFLQSAGLLPGRTHRTLARLKMFAEGLIAALPASYVALPACRDLAEMIGLTEADLNRAVCQEPECDRRATYTENRYCVTHRRCLMCDQPCNSAWRSPDREKACSPWGSCSSRRPDTERDSDE